jgi:SNF2 family DNA or RNA helicase
MRYYFICSFDIFIFFFVIIDRWHPGERCLAPSPDSEKLCEASIKSITVDESGKSFAVILYSDFQERRIPLKQLQEVKPIKECPRNFIFDDEDLEKPYFPDRKVPSSASAFNLSKDGDAIPYTINRYLRGYQREGAQFLYGHYVRGRGCILGDDMGLGKTVQVFIFTTLQLSLSKVIILCTRVGAICKPLLVLQLRMGICVRASVYLFLSSTSLTVSELRWCLSYFVLNA